MEQTKPEGEVLIVVNSAKVFNRQEFIDKVIQNQDILMQKNGLISSHSIQKLNFMELSCPISEATKTSSTNEQSQQKQDSSHKLSVQSQKEAHQYQSNLQALRNLPRQIHKNPNIKIECKTEFPLVRSVALQQFGWSLMSKQNHRQLVDVIWTDTYVTQELVNRLRPYQKVNHFPYSTQMGRKDYLFANLNKMRQRHKQDYDYFAKTWIFPQDYQKFKHDTLTEKSDESKFYIVKPVASCQGKGIYLTKKEDILLHTSQNKLLMQQYIQNTMLIQGLKFDVRIYVLVKSLQPLSIFVYKEGLTRLATNQYERPNDSNYRNGRMHLTNYAINKSNPSFVHNKDFRQDNLGHKRSLASLYQEIQKLGQDPQIIKQKINEIIVKTVLAVYEKMTVLQKNHHSHSLAKKSTKNLTSIDIEDSGTFPKEAKSHRINNLSDSQVSKIDICNKCFQLLGFDIMIDDKLEPKLIEINHQPSLTSSSPLDHVIKRCLLIDIFNLLNLDSKQKQKYLLSQRDVDPMANFRCIEVKGAKKQLGGVHHSVREKSPQLGGFRCIYPVENKDTMLTYNKIAPFLFQNENQKNERRKKQLYSKTNYPLVQNLEVRIKTSLAQKRTQYACHYVNMFSNTSAKNYDQIETQRTQIPQLLQKIQLINENGKEQEQAQLRIIHKKGNDFVPLHIVPKMKLKKMTEFQVPKKNLNFTIKYKKNKSQGKQIQQQSQIFNVIHQTSHLLDQNRSKTPGKLTFYNSNNKVGITRDKINSYQIHLTNDHYNNFLHIKQPIQSTHRHTSHESRIGIKNLRQIGENQRQKIKKITISQFFPVEEEPIQKHQAVKLQKYSYPLFEKRSSTIATNSGRESVGTASESRSIKKNNEFFQKMYQKQLMTRITKMKSMKQKLQKLNKSTLNNKIQENQFISKGENEDLPKKIRQNFKQVAQGKKSKTFSIHKIQSSLESKTQQRNKQTIYQTIKLMQFQQPQNRRVSHIRMQKSTNLKQRFNNNSMQMFKDEGFNSHRKKI